MSEAVSITVAAASGKDYPILVGSNILPRLGEWLKPRLVRPKIAVIADPTALAAQGEKLRNAIKLAKLEAVIIETPVTGEAVKQFTFLEEICSRLLDAHIERDDIILSFGGGAVGDLTGLAASLLKRGARCAHIPTTLLAQVDSAIGGKTGINTQHGKNLIGTFHAPDFVLADMTLTSTLPDREFLGGYAEIVKYGVIQDRAFFSWLEANGKKVLARDPEALFYAISKSCRIKAQIVSKDEKEQDERALLNFGHSFGHGLEILSKHACLSYDHPPYNHPPYNHGEAVAIGMVMACTLSAKLGLLAADEAKRVAAHLEIVGLPIKTDLLHDSKQTKKLLEIMRQDKKNKQGKNILVLAKAIGKACIYADLDSTDLYNFLSEAKI